jgi:hypothetical protein
MAKGNYIYPQFFCDKEHNRYGDDSQGKCNLGVMVASPVIGQNKRNGFVIF